MSKIFLTVTLLIATSVSAFSQCGGIGGWDSTPVITELTTSTITVAWTPVNSAMMYDVQFRQGDFGGFTRFGTKFADFPQPGSYSMVVRNLNPGVKYYIIVTARRTCFVQGIEEEETIDSNFTTNFTKPLQVNIREDLTISSTTTSINFKWDAVVCQFYAFNMTTSPTFEFNSYIRDPNNNNDINWIYGATVTEVTHNLFAPGTNYYYQVRAFSPHEGEYSRRSIAIPTRPVAPTGSAVANNDITTTSFVAKWTAANGNATKYLLDVSTSSTFNTRVAGYDAKEVNGTSQLVEGLTSGGHYYFRVRAFTSKFTTVNSASVEVRTTPLVLPAQNVTSTSVDASWAEAANIDRYLLYVSTKADFSSFVAGYNGAEVITTTKKIEGLGPASVYYYRIRTVRANVQSINSNAVKIVTSPALKPATAMTTNSFRANWEQGVDVDGYKVDVSTDQNFGTTLPGYSGAPVNALFLDIVGLSAGTQYYYRVRTHAGGLNSNNSSSSVYTTTLPPSIEPTTAIKTTSFTAHWNAPVSSTSFRLDVAYDQDFNQMVDGLSDVTVDGTSFEVGGLDPGTQFYFRVRSVNNSGPSANSLTVPAKTVSSAPASKPASNMTAVSIDANWDAPVGAESFRIDASTDSEFVPGSFVAGFNDRELAETSTSVTIPALTAGTEYFYRVRAVNVSGTSVNSQTIGSFTVPPAPLWKDQSESKSDRIDIRWDETRSATSYILEVSASESFDQPVNGYPLELPASNTNKIVLGLSPLTIYHFRVVAKNSAGGSSPSLTKSISTADANGSFPITELTLGTFSNIYVTGNDKEINITVSNPGGPVNVTFYHKQRSERDFVEVDLVQDASGHSRVVTSDAWFDTFGMEFYLEARDVFGQVKREPSGDGVHVIARGVNSFQIPISKFGKAPDNYELISFPYVMPKMTLEDVMVPVMGEYKNSSWRVLQYQNDGYKDYQNDGLRLQDVAEGTSYWFISRDNVELLFANGRSYSHSISQPFVMRLKKGWNQVGNPFTFPLTWSGILDANSNPDDVSPLYTFRGEDSTFPETDILEVFRGGFVFADNDIDITIPVTLSASSGRINASERNFEQTPTDWLLPLTLTQNGVVNNSPGIGMAWDASDGKDKLDRVTPPALFDFLEFNSRAEAFDFNLARNVVQSSPIHTWKFAVNSSSAGEVELSWNRETARNLGGLILWDCSGNAVVNMATTDRYITNESGEFKIIYSANAGSNDWSVHRFGDPFPNPFTKDVTIPVTYLENGEANVVLEITDPMGRSVFNGNIDALKPGVVDISWNGKSTDGNDVPAGLYIFKILGRRKNNEVFKLDGKVIKQ